MEEHVINEHENAIAGVGKGRRLMYDRDGSVVLVEYDRRGLELGKLTDTELTLAMVDRLVCNQKLLDGAEERRSVLEEQIQSTDADICRCRVNQELVIRALALQQAGTLETISEGCLHERVLEKR